jgi:hypothetical protein
MALQFSQPFAEFALRHKPFRDYSIFYVLKKIAQNVAPSVPFNQHVLVPGIRLVYSIEDGSRPRAGEHIQLDPEVTSVATE